MRNTKLLLTLPLSILLMACQPSEDSDSDASTDTNTPSSGTGTGTGTGSGSENTPITLTNIDASSSWAYVNLATQKTVTASDTWHLAFNGTSVISNTDTVTSALLAKQADFYTNGEANASVFTNATASSELEHLNASYDLTSDDYTFAADTLNPAIGQNDASWVTQNGRAYTAAPDNWWVIRNNTADAFAKIHATDLSYENYDRNTHQVSGVSISLEMYLQSKNDSGFSTAVTTWSPESASDSGAFTKCYDLDSTSEVACTSSDWDIKADVDYNRYKFNLVLNGGVSGTGQAGASAPYTKTEIDAVASGTDINSRAFYTDKNANVYTNDDTQWYAYDLTNQHKIWSNYRVYGLKINGGDNYLLQITNYYNTSTGDARNISIRYKTAE